MATRKKLQFIAHEKRSPYRCLILLLISKAELKLFVPIVEMCVEVPARALIGLRLLQGSGNLWPKKIFVHIIIIPEQWWKANCQ